MACLLLSLTPAVGLAEGTDPAMAEQWFGQGRSLLAEGDPTGACAAFRRSHELDPTAGALLGIGLCSERLGRLNDAWKAYQTAEQLARTANDGPRELAARERRAAVESNRPRLVIRVAGTTPIPGLRLQCDGEPMTDSMVGVEVLVAAGKHSCGASAPGFSPSSVDFLLPAESSVHHVWLPPLSMPPAAKAIRNPIAPPARVTAHPIPERPTNDWRAIGGPVVVGIGLGLVASGAVLAAQSASSMVRMDRHCTGDSPRVCDSVGVELHDSATRLQTAAIATFVAAALALPTGATLWATARKHSTAAPGTQVTLLSQWSW
ncbi:MAG TPA: hypothetical protein PLI95_04810 [Polyangiaceae bacterium]|nr:hypothetical protein [Polyangiaceae bacterium]